MASKPYNLHRNVETPVELQVPDDGAFLMNFLHSQPLVNLVQNLMLKVILNLILMGLLVTVVVIQIATLSCQNIE